MCVFYKWQGSCTQKNLSIVTQKVLKNNNTNWPKKMDGGLLIRLHPLEELQGINDPWKRKNPLSPEQAPNMIS